MQQSCMTPSALFMGTSNQTLYIANYFPPVNRLLTSLVTFPYDPSTNTSSPQYSTNTITFPVSCFTASSTFFQYVSARSFCRCTFRISLRQIRCNSSYANVQQCQPHNSNLPIHSHVLIVPLPLVLSPAKACSTWALFHCWTARSVLQFHLNYHWCPILTSSVPSIAHRHQNPTITSPTVPVYRLQSPHVNLFSSTTTRTDNLTLNSWQQ